MENRPETHRQPAVPPAVWLAGTVPAVIYGGAIAQWRGAGIGVGLWLVACAVTSIVRNRLPSRSPTATTTATTTDASPRDAAQPTDVRDASGTPDGQSELERDLFAQLALEPCAGCGTGTLLGTCLDCASAGQRRGADDSPGDDPDDRT